MEKYWPFCSPELPCNTSLAVGIITFIAFSLLVLWYYTKIKWEQKKEQEKIEAANRDWLAKNNLRDQTYRSIIETYFRVGGQYLIGIPVIDWKAGKIILSVQNNAQTIALEVNLDIIKWVSVTETIQPSARFVYDEKQLQADFEADYYYYNGKLELAIQNLSLEKILKLASTIEVTLSPRDYGVVHKSLI